MTELIKQDFTTAAMTIGIALARSGLGVLLVVVALAAVPTLLTGRRLSRLEGGLFIVTYLVYLGWLLLTRT